MIYCLHHYSIPLFWRWQQVQQQSSKSLIYSSRGWGSHRLWVSETSTSGTLSITSEDKNTQEADEWWECALAGSEKLGCWRTLSVIHACSSPCCSLPGPPSQLMLHYGTAQAGTSTGSRAAPAQRQTEVWEAFAHEWGQHAHTWGTETPWHPCAGHLLVKTIRKTCPCSAICSSS